MTQTASNVSVGKPRAAGGIYAGPTTAPVPTDATSELDGAIKGRGYASDSGVVSGVETSTEDVVAWRGAVVLTIRASRSETFTCTLIESLNEDVLAEVYGPENVSEVGGELVVIHNNKELPARPYVFEVLLTGYKVMLIVVPNAQVTTLLDDSYCYALPTRIVLT